MSYDLAVWHSEAPMDTPESVRIYKGLCEEWPFLDGSHPNVEAFYEDLTAKWPEIDTIPEDRVDDMDLCPWSCALNRSGMAVVMACVWSKAQEVAQQVTDLAEKHQLILFDPQGPAVLLPTSLQQQKKTWVSRLLRR